MALKPDGDLGLAYQGWWDGKGFGEGASAINIDIGDDDPAYALSTDRAHPDGIGIVLGKVETADGHGCAGDHFIHQGGGICPRRQDPISAEGRGAACISGVTGLILEEVVGKVRSSCALEADCDEVLAA